MKKLLLILSTIIFFVSLKATTYYVSTTGSDANNGAIGSPFLTLAKAESVVVAGDIVMVNAGTYTITGLTLSHSGTIGNVIEFRANGGTVTINVNGSINVTAQYRLMNGFTYVCNTATPILVTNNNNSFTNSTFTGTFTRAIWFKACASNLMQNITVTQNASVGYGLQVGEDANTGGEAADNNTLDNVRVIGASPASGTIHGVIFGGGGTGNVLKNSYIAGTAYGIVDKAETASLIFNNVFNFSTANGLYAMYCKGSINSQYYNNICRNSVSGNSFLIQPSDGGTPVPSGNIVRNNIYIKNASDATYLVGTAGSYTSDYNCWQYSSGLIVDNNPGTDYSTLAAWQATGQDAHSIAATPLFTNGSGAMTAIADYVPTSASPVVNVGVAITGRTTDALGNPIVGTPDMGALEYQGVTPPTGTTYYIATNGNDSWNGLSPTFVSGTTGPWAHIDKINGLALNPGDVVYIRAGNYTSNALANASACVRVNARNGTSANHILISSYPPDFPSGGRVVFNCSTPSKTANCFGIDVQNCSWIDFYGISVVGPAQTNTVISTGTITGAWYSEGSSNNRFINCEGSYSMTGFRLDDGVNTTFWNCDAHHQDDPVTGPPTGPHNNSDGFARTGSSNVATGTVYRGCRSWWNSDDAWDCFNTNGTITYDSCWAFWNGYLPGTFTTGGDGNGLKMGGGSTNVPTPITRFVSNCVTFQNRNNGFDQNGGNFTAQFYNNTAFGNLGNSWKFGYFAPNLHHVFKNNIAFSNGINYASTDATGWTQSNNSWLAPLSVSAADFQSTSTTGVDGVRQPNGTLPVNGMTFLHLTSSSALRDAGVNVGIPFNPPAPDLGAFEFGAAGASLSATATPAQNPVTCNGSSTTVTVNATGGTSPYQYNVNGGAFSSTNTFAGTGAGTYVYQVKDATSTIVSTTLNITQPSQITITQTSGTITVNGGTTTTTVTATGGTGTLSYKLDAGSFVSTNVFTGVAAGTHTITVRDANLCTNTLTYTLTQPSVLNVSAAATTNPVTCFGNTTTITVTATGGTTPYTYSINGGSFGSTNTFTGRGAGSYTLTVRDNAGATATTTLTITQPTQITIAESHTAITVNGNSSTVTVTASGGTGTLNYSINGTTFQAFNVFSGVLAGTYTITVRDANLCTNTLSFTITQPTALTANASSGTISCFGATTTLTISASGGTPAYTYAVAGIGSQSSNVFTNVVAGTYNITVSDAGGAVFSFNQTITQPAQITITESHTPIIVNGGITSITVTATGGTGTKMYSLDNGTFQSSNVFTNVLAGNHTIRVRDANGCINFITFTISQPNVIAASATAPPILCNGGGTTATVTATGGTPPYTYSIDGTIFQSSNQFTNLDAGTYVFTVRDNLGVKTTTFLTITQPAPIVVSVTIFSDAPTTVTTSLTGGTGPYLYRIDGGANQSSNTFNNVSAGNHTITVTDANGCTGTKTFTVNNPVGITASFSAIVCNGGSTNVTIGATGGVPPYNGTGVFSRSVGTYQFQVSDSRGSVHDTILVITEPALMVLSESHSAILINGGTSTVTAAVTGGTGTKQYSLDGGAFQLSTSFAGVLAGNHTLTVKDANNCQTAISFSIVQPGQLFTDVSYSAITCFSGTTSVTITAHGGTTPYSVTGGSPQTKGSGTYTFRVTDAFGAIADTIVTITAPTQIIISVSTGTIAVNGGNTTVTATASGGTGGLQYKIDGGAYQGTGSFSGVTAGIHTVTVKDANNCTNTNTFTITQPGVLIIGISRGSAITCTGGTQNITVSGSGGTAPYTGTGVFAKSAGTYTMSITDAFGARADTIITVTEPSAILVSVATGTILLNGGTTTVTVTASGGTGGLQYKLDGGAYQGSNAFAGVAAGPHTVTVKDANACTTVNTFSISQPTPLTISVSPTTITSYGGTSTVTTSASGGTLPYTGTGVSFHVAGTYTFTVTDAFGAVADTIVTITQPNQITVTAVIYDTILVYGGTTDVTIQNAGGTPIGDTAYEYKIDAGGFTQSTTPFEYTFTAVSGGNHTITIRDANSYTITYIINVVQPAAPAQYRIRRQNIHHIYWQVL